MVRPDPTSGTEAGLTVSVSERRRLRVCQEVPCPKSGEHGRWGHRLEMFGSGYCSHVAAEAVDARHALG
ncbi:hypothetical protein CDD83_6842 [Cordyceps sp. RAO-2017]|nr:hypothetical protein CDD83_6842 [Cordyceps sp. RAO-2017]